MKSLSIPILLFLLIFSYSCKKDPKDRNYIIQGRILESNSNPVPVNNYQLRISQGSFIYGPPGSSKDFQTDANGYFSVNFQPAKGTLLGGLNDYPLFIYSIDTSKYIGIGSYWSNIKALIDTNLNTIYLYKKIDRLIRKIQFTTALALNDSTTITTNISGGAFSKTFYGPISAGTLLIADTLRQVKLTDFDMQSNPNPPRIDFIYSTIIVQLQTYSYSLQLVPGDEPEREVVLDYH